MIHVCVAIYIYMTLWHRSTFISTDKYEDEIEENVCMIRVDIRCYSLVINVHDYHLDQIKWHLST